MFLKEFKDLRRKRDKLRGLPDQLNYAIPIDDYHDRDEGRRFSIGLRLLRAGPQFGERRGTRRASRPGQSSTCASR